MGHETNPFLLPSQVFIDGGDSSTLALTSKDGSSSVGNIKIQLFDDPDGYLVDNRGQQLPIHCTELAAGYLALVLRHARRWFLHHQGGAYGRFDLRWMLNLGIPSAGFDDAQIRDLHRRIGQAAWWLSIQEGPITLEGASDGIQKTGKPGFDFGLSADSLSVVPEVAAEVVGYARSDFRRKDLHVMVDIGASTMDVCGFILREQRGEDRYELLTADVQKLGVFRLHMHRINKVQACFRIWVRKELLPKDPIAPILKDEGDYCPQQETLASLDDYWLDEDFSRACLTMMMTTLMGLKKHRYPGFPFPTERVPVFLCGGGSRSAFYKDLMNKAHERFRKAGHMGLESLQLPLPQLANRDLDQDKFQFLGVAYGLSYPSYDIGNIRPPSEIPSVDSPRKVDWQRYYVSKDQV
ncbi:MAG: hypothetical protein ACREX3_14010 [Gammaproteobacteria bacterium]